MTYTVTDTATPTPATATLTFTVTVDAEVPAATVEAPDEPLAYELLPEVARAITDSTVTAITQRLEQVRTGPASGTLVLGGQSTLADVLTTGGRALAAGTLDVTDVLSRSEFVLPLNAQSPNLKRLTIWGGGDYRTIGGKADDIVDWDGDLFNAHVGADAMVRENLLAGASVSWSQIAFDYRSLTGDSESDGDATITLTSVHPYLGWTTRDKRLALWATAGYGWGDLTITPDVATTSIKKMTSDVTLRTVGGGISGQVMETAIGQMRLNAEVAQTALDVTGNSDLAAKPIEARRARVSLTTSATHTWEDGAYLTPSVEVGVRQDAGDGRTGSGRKWAVRCAIATRLVASRWRVMAGCCWGITGTTRTGAPGACFRWSPARAGRG